MKQTRVLQNRQEQDSLSLKPESFVIVLEDLFPQNVSIRAFFFGKLSSLCEYFNEISFEFLDLLKIALDIGGNVLEIPELISRFSFSTGLYLHFRSAPEEFMIPFQNSLIERVILCLAHEFLNCCNRSNGLAVEFVRTLFKSFLEDLSF